MITNLSKQLHNNFFLCTKCIRNYTVGNNCNNDSNLKYNGIREKIIQKYISDSIGTYNNIFHTPYNILFTAAFIWALFIYT